MTEPGLTPLELAAGTVFGLDPAATVLPRRATGGVRAVLEAELLGPLTRPPCVISFSGGRDSSAVLALATAVARREGLPDPIPVSLVFPASRTAGESDYQQLVVEHLGLAEWERVAVTDELDVVGPVAQRALHRLGPTWPFNAYFHDPVLARAAGGTVLTGIGGDELFGPWTWSRENAVLRRAARPRPLDPVRIAVATGPQAARRRFLALRLRAADLRPDTWLRPQARAEVERRALGELARESLSYARTVRHALWRSRARSLGLRTLDRLAAPHGVRCVSPLSSAPVMAAVAAERGFAGYPDRTAAMTAVVGDLLPAALVGRSGKAAFTDVFFAGPAREFARAWAGGGVDTGLVRPDELRRIWGSPEPDARTFALFQAAWLAAHPASQ